MAKPALTGCLPRRALEDVLGLAWSPEIQGHFSGSEKITGVATEENHMSAYQPWASWEGRVFSGSLELLRNTNQHPVHRRSKADNYFEEKALVPVNSVVKVLIIQWGLNPRLSPRPIRKTEARILFNRSLCTAIRDGPYFVIQSSLLSGFMWGQGQDSSLFYFKPS